MVELKFADNLKNVLKAKNISQQEIAERLKVTQPTINRWSNGVTEPNLKMLLELCEFLDESPNSLLGFDDGI